MELLGHMKWLLGSVSGDSNVLLFHQLFCGLTEVNWVNLSYSIGSFVILVLLICNFGGGLVLLWLKERGVLNLNSESMMEQI